MNADNPFVAKEFDRLAEVELDAAGRHRELRAQWIAQQRVNGDGHGRGRRPSATMNELRKRRARRRAKQRARATVA